MKVLCVSTPVEKRRPPMSILKETERYNVVDAGNASEQRMSHDWYELAEHKGFIYAQHHFIPLSSISETNMVREYNKEKTTI